jgi:DNA-binding SARP family transcriptional activator
VEIRVLGPVEAWHAGRSLYLARRQQRLILGILALEADRLVGCDRLIDLLWGSRPPRRARAVVQSRVSELRTALHDHQQPDTEVRLATRGNGYVLLVSPELVDAHQFRMLTASWRETRTDDEARLSLRRALALWRGLALGGDLTPEAQSMCQGLQSARLTVAEDLFEIELRLGNHDQVADEIRDLAAANPGRERLVGQLLLALHRGGRTPEALRFYDRWRRWLGDELGIDPGRDLQRLHLALLQDDPTVAGEADQRTSQRAPGKVGGVAVVDDQSAQRALETSRPLEGGLSSPDRDRPNPAGTRQFRQFSQFGQFGPCLLPSDIADFTGRGQQVAEVRRLLHPDTPAAAVVISAIAGKGGVGKTALAVHVAHGLRAEFPDGQLYRTWMGPGRDPAIRRRCSTGCCARWVSRAS